MFFILDGHALAYRHYFAQINRPLMTGKGEPTSAVFGFARTLMDVLEKDKPYYLAVAFDEGMSGRDTMYAEYKGTREKMPDDLDRQMARIYQLVDAFNIPMLRVSGYEADDVMGTIALQAEAAGLDVRISTGDRDIFQLLSEHTTVRYAISQPGAPDEIYDVARFRERYTLEPIQLIDLKAMEGDTSDNIPGVRGVGKKGATTLLHTYGTLEAIYENLPALSASLRNKLEEGRESAFLSKRLATIQRDVPITLDQAACVAHEFDKGRVEAIFRELEFGSMFRQLERLTNAVDTSGRKPATGSALTVSTSIEDSGQLSMFSMGAMEVITPPAPPPVEDAPSLYETRIIRDRVRLNNLVEVLRRVKRFAFDTETTDTNKTQADLVGISIAVNEEVGYYIPVGHEEEGQLPMEEVIEALRPAFTSPTIEKFAHNALYDLVVMQTHGIDVTPITFDTMIAEWIRDPLSQELSLKRLARKELNVNMTTIDELIGRGKTQTTMDHVTIALAAPYAVADAVTTLRLVDRLAPMLEKPETDPPVDALWGTDNPPSPRHVFDHLEMPLIPVLSAMERAGVLLDLEFLHEMSGRLAGILASTESEIYALNGGYGPFNINSPKQLNEVLFGKMGLKAEGIRKTAHGVSTAADVLENMRGDHPIIEKILQYRELSKLKGTYVDAFPSLINPRTGRLHTSFNQAGTSTGRVSSSNPNLQNIPTRTDIGREVRRAFITPPGMKLLAVDYSQVELRIMAHITEEPTLLDAFQQGLDIHATTAAVVNNVPIEAVTREMRNFAKRVNFGLLYGMGAFRLARDSDLTYAQASAFVNTYFERLPGVLRYIEGTKALAYKQGFLTTLYGRRRTFPGLVHGNRSVKSASEREAINMPIQGTAADIMKRAMIDLYAEIGRRKLGARIMIQVHDELLLEVPENEVMETAALVREIMEGAAVLRAPLQADAEYGDNWADLVDIPR